MTDNQFREIMDKMTKSVSGVQRLEEGQARLEKDVSVLKQDVSELKQDVSILKQDVSELKQDVSELKVGQTRLEKETQTIGKVIEILADDSIRTRARVAILEDQRALSN